MKKLIQQINILGTDWTIKWCPVSEVSDEDKNTIGLMLGGSRTIVVDPSGPLETQVNILCHEIAHAAFNIAGLSHLLKNNMEEAICDIIGGVFSKILREGIYEKKLCARG